jgi:hypothetical protein
MTAKTVLPRRGETHLSHFHATSIKAPRKLADDAYAVSLSSAKLCLVQSGHNRLHSFNKQRQVSDDG